MDEKFYLRRKRTRMREVPDLTINRISKKSRYCSEYLVCHMDSYLCASAFCS